MTTASPKVSVPAFAASAALACVLGAGLLSSCVPHGEVTPSVEGPDPTDIIEEQEVSVAAQDGVVFSIRSAQVTVPPGSLEFDAFVHAALVKESALPDDVSIPENRKALAVFWFNTEVRVAGRWPVEFQIMSDFQDPDPYDPDFRIHRLNPETSGFEDVTDATITRTYVAFRALPGYFVVSVPLATPQAIGLAGSQAVGHIAFPSTVMDDVDSAFGIRATGTDFERFTNALAAGFRDRPYVSGNGNRLAIVRESLDGSVADRLYGTTPSNPLGHLTLAATAQQGTRLGDVCFHPSGDSVVVAGQLVGAGTFGGGVFLADLVGDDEPTLLYRDPGPGLPVSVAISPDGGRLAIATARFFPEEPAGVNFDVIVVPVGAPLDPSDEQVVRLTTDLHTPDPPGDDPPQDPAAQQDGGDGDGEEESGPTEPLAVVEAVGFSHDGATVYFGAYREGAWRVYAAAADGSSLTELEVLRGYRWPAAGPDGTEIAVGRNDRMYLHRLGTDDIDPVGPPANGFGAGLVSRGTTKISWRGR
jgi:hypothetical protein